MSVDFDDLYDATKNIKVIEFKLNDSTNKPMGYSGNMRVYVNRDYLDQVSAGDTWVCSLELNPNGGNWFARPIMRFDASFFADLREDQIDRMAAELWKRNPNVVLPKLKEMYREALAGEISKEKESELKAKDDEIAALKQSLADAERKAREDEGIIESLRKDAARAPAKAPSVAPAVSPMQPYLGSSTMRFDVERVGPDTIASESFDSPRYFVHITGDRKMLLLRPDPNGHCVCTDGEISLYGLGMLSPESPARNLVAEYSPRFGGIVVYL